ncbi:putative outer membrane lipoprotein with glycine-zipper 2TM domain [Pseudomonas syringae pv. apii]|uniref:Putative outer membrane lipoprotein with glycine-zipper 2TM domain n=1 Tax=Pseudomonas syringae pv. apii TaxID=81036 RepID=A0A3M5X470_9PSED|nr:putative outer membrane lipoprotein with glycine-zipper 2TM domain [Pseudomonas syringae pv. apii]
MAQPCCVSIGQEVQVNKSMLVGAVLGAAVVTAGGAVATYSLVKGGPEYADVLAVEPINQQIKTPREVCKDVTVTRQAPVKDQHQIVGSVIGAVAGGLLGNQVGGGNGKKIATVAGALGGGYAGNKVQEGMQERDTYTTTQNRCTTVNDVSDKVVGYNVKYKLNEKVGQVRMERDPGSQIPVDKNGQLILGQAQ